MVGRPVNQRRRDELLDAVVDYAVDHGFAALTWRPLAAALNVTPTTLVHRFGSKEGLVQAVQQRLREQIIAETAQAHGQSVDIYTYARRVWERVSDPARDGEFRLFFAVYGQALQTPEVFGDFLDHVITEPLAAFAGADIRVGDARGTDLLPAATLLIAAIRGLLLDLLTTGDRARVEAAADALFATRLPTG